MGPTTVQVDLTDACNQSCHVCWLHAPDLKAKNKERLGKLESLPIERVLALFDELKAIGTEEIYFAGGGEPFAHPKAWEAIEGALHRGLTASLHTNFSLVGDVQRLIDLGVHHVTVSLWAGTREAYAATHPGTAPEVFDQVTEALAELNRRKVDRPVTKLYHVLTTANAGDVAAMLELAERLGCDAMELAVADTVPGATDPLGLAPAQAAQLLLDLQPWEGRAAWRRPRLLGFEALRTRLQAVATGRPSDVDLVHEIPCFAGWTYARVMADGRVIPCLKAHRIPSGNIHDASFADIWDGTRQAAFREAARSALKAGPLFASIGNDDGAACGCERGCDNLEANRRTAERLRSLTSLERGLLRTVGRFQR
ncbi:MAG: radical SAM protein [Proteobacteria bacterium]|nr:radical SAM protein [Pseudomonadota bacterium]